MKCDRKWWLDGREQSVRAEDGAQHPEPRLRRIVVWMCEACIEGEGGECHTPGCVLWINRAPDMGISNHPCFELLPDGAP